MSQSNFWCSFTGNNLLFHHTDWALHPRTSSSLTHWGSASKENTSHEITRWRQDEPVRTNTESWYFLCRNQVGCVLQGRLNPSGNNMEKQRVCSLFRSFEHSYQTNKYKHITSWEVSYCTALMLLQTALWIQIFINTAIKPPASQLNPVHNTNKFCKIHHLPIYAAFQLAASSKSFTFLLPFDFVKYHFNFNNYPNNNGILGCILFCSFQLYLFSIQIFFCLRVIDQVLQLYKRRKLI
jgi:hypothetical protein